MKILYVNRAMGTLFGGGEAFDLGAARHMQKRGHEVTLLTGVPLRQAANNVFDDVEIIGLATPNVRRWSYATERTNGKLSAAFYHLDNHLFEREVRAWLNSQTGRRSFDIVQCCSLFDLPERLLRESTLPVVSWLPGPPSGRARASIKRLLRDRHFGLFTHGAPVAMLEQQMGLVQGRDFDSIEPGVELDRIAAHKADRLAVRHELGFAKDALVGMTTARLVPVKNLALLLNGIAAARDRGVIWHWLLAGDGPNRPALQQQCNSLHLQAQVRFLGQQTSDQVHRWLSAVDLFALTSTYENFSVAVLEAMAHSLPIIGTDVGYLQHLLRQSGGGLIVAHDAPHGCADKLVELAAEPTKRHELGRRGRAYVERLDWPKIAERLEQVYLRAQAGRQP
jgi:glycosyltransferase involved in cell wall biosynthesis